MHAQCLRSACCVLAVLAAATAVAVAQPPPSGPVSSIPLLPDGVQLNSAAGYITVNEQTGSNLFYWFFQAQKVDPTTAPVLVWLNGGPGSSSMYGLFEELGPFSVSPDGSTLQMREITWTNEYNVIFIDNPVGTGFSYTQSDSGFVTNQSEVGADLLSFIYSFYQLYPQWLNNKLFICGESYAGKYVPAFAYAIHTANKALALQQSEHSHSHRKHKHSKALLPNAVHVPLSGISIGDGMMDPLTQVPGYGHYLFGLSMISRAERLYMESVEGQIVELIKNNSWIPAFRLFDPLMMGDEFPYPSYFINVTGLTDYYNFDSPSYPANPFEAYLNRADVQAALHVAPGFVYSSGNNTVEEYLLADWMQSIQPWLVELLDAYPVLIYNGQNDIILNAVQCEQFLQNLQWNGSDQWNAAKRTVWKLNPDDYEVGGYVQQGGGLTYVIVRGGGHLLPQDQPARAQFMIDHFVQGIAWPERQ